MRKKSSKRAYLSRSEKRVTQKSRKLRVPPASTSAVAWTGLARARKVNKKEIRLPSPRQIRPFILTCDKRLDSFEKFVISYEKIASSMLEPVLIIDDRNEETRERYHELLLRLKPFATIAQPRYKENDFDNLQYFMIKDFPLWALHFTDEDILFMEDDIAISSGFPAVIKKASQYIQGSADFITFYGASKYSVIEDHPSYNFMTPFSGNDYYGNLCILFNRRVIKDFDTNWKVLNKMDVGPWDLKWGCYMEKRGYKLYQTRCHYANHLVGKSAISGKFKEEYDGKHFKE